MNLSRRLFNIARAAAGKGIEEAEKIFSEGRGYLDKELDLWESRLEKEKSRHSSRPQPRPLSQKEQDLGVFNLSPGATWEEIKKAYRRESKKYHSDLYQREKEKKEIAEEIMTILNGAYERLKKGYGKK